MTSETVALVLTLCCVSCSSLRLGPPDLLSDACRFRRCPYGTVCRLQNVVCNNPPCNPVPSCVSGGAKEGSCPTPRFDQMAMCAELCTSDDECSGRSKCCSNGCGKTCQNPSMSIRNIKPGRCTRPLIFGRPSDLPTACRGRCLTDGDCPGSDKCCSSLLCGRSCQAIRRCPMWDPYCRFRQYY